jgi:hypothetical protein
MLLGHDTADTNTRRNVTVSFLGEEVKEHILLKEHHGVTNLMNMYTICLTSATVETTALIKAQ